MEKSAALGDREVRVQMLTIDSKKLTLQLFKQVPIIDDMRGVTPWGRVIYSIKDQGNEWIVGERDGGLVRFRLDYSNSTKVLLARLEDCRKNAEREAKSSFGILRNYYQDNIATYESALKRRVVEDEMRAPLVHLPQLYL